MAASNAFINVEHDKVLLAGHDFAADRTPGRIAAFLRLGRYSEEGWRAHSGREIADGASQLTHLSARSAAIGNLPEGGTTDPEGLTGRAAGI